MVKEAVKPVTDNSGFTKTDMERLGFFKEMSYTTVGENFTASKPGKYIYNYMYYTCIPVILNL